MSYISLKNLLFIFKFESFGSQTKFNYRIRQNILSQNFYIIYDQNCRNDRMTSIDTRLPAEVLVGVHYSRSNCSTNTSALLSVQSTDNSGHINQIKLSFQSHRQSQSCDEVFCTFALIDTTFLSSV